MNLTEKQRAFLQSVKQLLDEHEDIRVQIIDLKNRQVKINERILVEQKNLNFEELNQLDRVCCRVDEELYLFTVNDEGYLDFERLDEVVLQDNRAPWE